MTCQNNSVRPRAPPILTVNVAGLSSLSTPPEDTSALPSSSPIVAHSVIRRAVSLDYGEEKSFVSLIISGMTRCLQFVSLCCCVWRYADTRGITPRDLQQTCRRTTIRTGRLPFQSSSTGSWRAICVAKLSTPFTSLSPCQSAV